MAKDVLNFSSPMAYKCFVKGTQTHKAWQSLEIFLHGTMLELIELYCKESNVSTPSAIDFIQWQKCIIRYVIKVIDFYRPSPIEVVSLTCLYQIESRPIYQI